MERLDRPPPTLVVHQGEKDFSLRWREPATGEVLALLLPPPQRIPRQVRLTLMREFQLLIDRVNDAYAGETVVLQLLDDPSTRHELQRMRRALYDGWPLQGRLGTWCPHCGTRVELSLSYFWSGLRLAPWQFLDADELLLPPCIATPMPVGPARSPWPTVDAFWVRYPGLEPAEIRFGRADAGEPAAAGADIAPPALRAMQRMSLALGKQGAEGVAAVERMPLGAFFLCDLLYFAAHHPLAPASQRLRVDCRGCGAAFKPALVG